MWIVVIEIWEHREEDFADQVSVAYGPFANDHAAIDWAQKQNFKNREEFICCQILEVKAP